MFASRINAVYVDGKILEVCEKCGDLKIKGLPDVSEVHAPYFDENLRDNEHRKGTLITSRFQKAEVLKRLGLREYRESTVKYYSDPNKRRNYCRDNFGANG